MLHHFCTKRLRPLFPLVVYAATSGSCARAPQKPPVKPSSADKQNAPTSAEAAPTTSAPGITSFPSPYPILGSIEVLDARMTKLVAADAQIEKLAEGFRWSEGPMWVPSLNALLFSDVPANIIYKWTEAQGVSIFMQPSGFHGEHTDSTEPGANGLALDLQGKLLMCQHGNRQVARLEEKLNQSSTTARGPHKALATHYEGKRLNSPNDLAVHSSGSIFFTDPPYGLPKRGEPEPAKELPYSGVFRWDPGEQGGKVTRLDDTLERPNGIALSPDERTLYVANSHGPRPILKAYDLTPDKGVTRGRVLFDATDLAKRTHRKGGNDGMAIDEEGNIFATGPGGVLVLSPTGEHLGTILTTEPTANCKFGDDGRTLYITSNMNLLRVRTKARGFGFSSAQR